MAPASRKKAHAAGKEQTLDSQAAERALRRRAGRIVRALAKEYSAAECALLHDSALQLLVATILSAQCTDRRVNMVTPALFARYPTADDFADADPDGVVDGVMRSAFGHANQKCSAASRVLVCSVRPVRRHHGRPIRERRAVPAVGAARRR